MVSVYFSTDKLNRQNFARWEKDMKYLLMERKCYDLVIEKESRPEKNQLIQNLVQLFCIGIQEKKQPCH